MAAVESSVPSFSVVSAEVLTYTLSSKLGNPIILKEEQKLAIFFFVLCERCFYMVANGIQEESVSKRFHFCSTGGTHRWDPSVKKMTCLIHVVRVNNYHVHINCLHKD